MTVLQRIKIGLSAALMSAALASCATTGVGGMSSAPANLGELKTELKRYHDSGQYERDLNAVAARAQAYVERRATQVERPALVLDIDETSLLNWGVMAANDFGYIANGPCDELPRGPCGQIAWDTSGRATAIAGTLALYESARAHHVAVFFITGRREAERAATEANLRAIGYTQWDGLAMRPQDSHGTSAAYKTEERGRIEAQGYRIIANVGDQESDLSGGHAERTFKMPNPYYFIP